MCQEEFLVANWTQVQRTGLQPFLHRGLTKKTYCDFKACTELPAFHTELNAFYSSHLGQTLERSSWNGFSTNRTMTFPIQLELHSYILHQHLPQPVRATPFWPKRTLVCGPIKQWEIGVSFCLTGGDFSLYKSAFSLDLGAHFLFPPKAACSRETGRLSRNGAVEQSWLPRERHLAAMLLYNWAVALLSCSTAALFSQLCCIAIRLLSLNKTSCFTTVQIGSSCGHWIEANDH